MYTTFRPIKQKTKMKNPSSNKKGNERRLALLTINRTRNLTAEESQELESLNQEQDKIANKLCVTNPQMLRELRSARGV